MFVTAHKRGVSPNPPSPVPVPGSDSVGSARTQATDNTGSGGEEGSGIEPQGMPMPDATTEPACRISFVADTS